MKCENCCYYWTEEDMKYPTCHWGYNPYDSLEMAPCEREEFYYEED